MPNGQTGLICITENLESSAILQCDFLVLERMERKTTEKSFVVVKSLVLHRNFEFTFSITGHSVLMVLEESRES